MTASWMTERFPLPKACAPPDPDRRTRARWPNPQRTPPRYFRPRGSRKQGFAHHPRNANPAPAGSGTPRPSSSPKFVAQVRCPAARIAPLHRSVAVHRDQRCASPAAHNYDAGAALSSADQEGVEPVTVQPDALSGRFMSTTDRVLTVSEQAGGAIQTR